ncbi:hypothetical protein SRS16P2_00473 (plasmid) [Variovorax sp. SRS16]|nr:hypothetical protein SRS16P2_00473 [Variovorax sp. SRS16]
MSTPMWRVSVDMTMPIHDNVKVHSLSSRASILYDLE